MRLYLDIETAPTSRPEVVEYLTSKIEPPSNYKSEEAIKKWWATRGAEKTKEVVTKTALNPAFGKVIAIGVTDAESDRELIAVGDEHDVLEEFHSEIFSGEKARPTFVGFNIFGFDLPFLYRRAVILGHTMLALRLMPYVTRWYDNTEHTIDLMLEWTLGRYGEHISMRELALALGIEGVDMNESGAGVPEMYEKGDLDGVVEHLKRDLALLAEIDKRWL